MAAKIGGEAISYIIYILVDRDTSVSKLEVAMFYNVLVSHFDDELQLNFYDCMLNRKEEENADEENVLEDEFSSETDISDDRSYTATDMEANKIRSTRRTKQTIYEYARANNWDYFSTFTFAVNRHEYEVCKNRLTKFLRNFKYRSCPDFEYLIVPELHKDGAIHFHGLLKGEISDHLSKKTHEKDKFIFKKYHYGISEVEVIKDRYKVSNYITKYITKDLLIETKGKRRFMVSSGVRKPKKDYYYFKDKSLVDILDEYFPEFEVSYLYKSDRMGSRFVQLKRVEDQEEDGA